MVSILGLVGGILGGAMVLMFAVSSAFGLNTPLAREVVLGVLAVSNSLVYRRQAGATFRGIDVTYAFKEIPPE